MHGGSRFIGSTTVLTGEDWSPTFRLGDQQCIGPPIGRSLQKAKKNQSKYYFIISVGCFLVLTTRGATTTEKDENLELI